MPSVARSLEIWMAASTARGLALLLLFCAFGCEESPPTTETQVAPLEAVQIGGWSESERSLLKSLSLASLPPPPANPSNRVAGDPVAAELGHRLFFDPGLSRDGSLSCASCHVADLLFTDGRPTSQGLALTGRNAPSLVGSAHSTWQFWDGRRDSLWAQALGPIETAAEMGSTRVAVVRQVVADSQLAALYGKVFGELPEVGDDTRFPERAGPFGDAKERDAWFRMTAADQRLIDIAFANVGKAIEAYERLLLPGPSRFDDYVDALSAPDSGGGTLSEEEIRGLRLFVDAGRTLCLRCHNGPLLTNQAFHDIGTASGESRLPDFGRFLGLQAVLIDPFNCLGPFSDAPQEDCKELRFIDKRHADLEMGKFKTPTLRGLARTGPYMHDGRFGTLEEVVDFYRSPPVGPEPLEITPLEIDDDEAKALAAFLRTLDGGIAVEERWLRPPGAAKVAGLRAPSAP